ncbi:INTEGRAL MEMBRANE PROTEIN (Rhomboid family) [Candidatus Rhodobacter oscarellae]|uniref:Probable membrane transporter protein n=1 Tax=Candidatus Rhodobacter oscarellae TaxID=1675527 RepID=A0A0J9E5A8_9RHOB|nr:sulfite exporter TauE/SafE family protein [Candidatus Rhodobacter lobularis]KMW57960.1 INTEGRAL MEMBRANE PROTEIN (Rhomboid family) [Candidatus Rhodobacter lobularis]
MALDFTFFAVAIPCVLFLGIDKAGFGSASAIAVVPVLTLILEPAETVALMLPLLLAMDFVALRAYWGKWEPVTTRVLIAGSVPGAFLGAAVIAYVSVDVFRLLIGALALGFVAFRLAQQSGALRLGTREMSDPAGFAFALGAGATSFIAHAGGPVASVYLLSKKLTKLEYQATTIIAFWVNNLVKIVLYLWLGFLSWQTALADLYLLPFAVLGTLLGVRVHRVVPEKLYFTLIYLFLTIAGTKLVFDALA